MTESKDDNKLRAKIFSNMLEQAYIEGKEEYKNSVSVQLLELPEQIKKQSIIIYVTTSETEKLRLSIDERKNQALELVLCTTEEGKQKYTNDKARKVAVDQTLRDDKVYLDNLDELGRKEAELRREHIQYEYLKNMFTAYCSIAGMNGGK